MKTKDKELIMYMANLGRLYSPTIVTIYPYRDSFEYSPATIGPITIPTPGEFASPSAEPPETC